jgi:phosphatidylserine decarboxylase
MLLSRRSWQVARRYAGPPLAAGAALAAARRWQPAAAMIASGGAVLLFFRDPRRPLRPDPGTAYAPADGLVTAVAEDAAVPWLPGTWTRVSIFLGLQNVHVARAPAAGELQEWQWVDGACHAALSARAAQENRQARVRIITPGGDPVWVVLAAGMIARRITAWAGPGDTLGADGGELSRLGLIHLGSRADVLLPARWVPQVRPGLRVRAGITPIARTRR